MLAREVADDVITGLAVVDGLRFRVVGLVEAVATAVLEVYRAPREDSEAGVAGGVFGVTALCDLEIFYRVSV